MSADELARAEARIHELEALAAGLTAELLWSDRRTEMLRQTLGSFFHDIRGPLRGASGFAELLGRRGLDDERSAHYLAAVSEYVHETAAMIESQSGLMAFSGFDPNAGDLAASIRGLEATVSSSRLRMEVPARRLSVPLSQDRLDALVRDAVAAVARGAPSDSALDVEVRAVPAGTNHTGSRHVCLRVAAPALPGADPGSWARGYRHEHLEEDDPVVILAEESPDWQALMVWMPLFADRDAQ